MGSGMQMRSATQRAPHCFRGPAFFMASLCFLMFSLSPSITDTRSSYSDNEELSGCGGVFFCGCFFFWFLIFVFFLELVFSTLKTKQTNQKTKEDLRKSAVAHRGFFKERMILSNSSPDATRKRKHVDSLKFLAGKQGQLAYLT